MSREEEQEIGEKGAAQVEGQFGLVQNPALQAYVGGIGERLALHSPRQSVAYRVRVIEMDEPNAFALPGGQIYVSRGLVLLTNSKAELANVIAHEIGHVAARHAAQRHAHASTFGLATLLGTIAAGGRGDEVESIGGPAGVAAYGRNQERAADRIGMELAVSARVDPGGLASFLRSLEKWERLQHGFSAPQSYFSSHPGTGERIAEAASSAEVGRHSNAPLPNEDTSIHLAHLDGISVGRPALEGTFVGERFVHADLGVSVRFPHGWEARNENSQVVAVAPGHRAIVLMQLVGEGDDAAEAAKRNAEEEEFELEGGVPVRVGGLAAFRARATIATSFGPMDAEVTWLVFNGLVFRLAGGVSKGGLERYQGSFRSFVRSFRRLLPAEYEQISDLRLELVRSQEGETLREISRRTGNEWDLNQTAVINAVGLEDGLAEGRLVKVAVRRLWVSRVDQPGRTGAADGD